MADPDAAIALPDDVAVVNIGLALFADAVRDQSAAVEQVDWRIPADGQLDLVTDLECLYGRVVPGMSDRVLLHCGPAIEWLDICDPLRRSMRAATVSEGWAQTVDEADRMLADGTVRLEPGYRHHTVLPLASAIGPSAPVFVVDNRDGDTRAFAPINQGPGETAWFGRDTPSAIARLDFLRDVAAPTLRQIIERSGPIDLFRLAAQGSFHAAVSHCFSSSASNWLVLVSGRAGRGASASAPS